MNIYCHKITAVSFIVCQWIFIETICYWTKYNFSVKLFILEYSLIMTLWYKEALWF